MHIKWKQNCRTLLKTLIAIEILGDHFKQAFSITITVYSILGKHAKHWASFAEQFVTIPLLIITDTSTFFSN